MKTTIDKIVRGDMRTKERVFDHKMTPDELAFREDGELSEIKECEICGGESKILLYSWLSTVRYRIYKCLKCEHIQPHLGR